MWAFRLAKNISYLIVLICAGFSEILEDQKHYIPSPGFSVRSLPVEIWINFYVLFIE